MSLHLGVNVFHDVGFAIVDDNGKPLIIYEEPKFTGRKEEYFYPLQSLDQIVNDGFSEFKSITWPIDLSQAIASTGNDAFTQVALNTFNNFKTYLNSYFKIEKEFKVHHHAAHAESVFFASGYKTSHILIVDGAGEDQSISIFYGDVNAKQSIKEIVRVPRTQFSYGHLYGFFTSYLGYSKGTANSHCGKIMGLSSYGQPKYLEDLNNLYHNDLDLFPSNHLQTFDFLTNKFGGSFCINDKLTEEQVDIAASLQSFIEQDLIRILREAPAYYSNLPESQNLCIAGGVGMNSVANGKILLSELYSDIFVQPASTDCGIAYGAAHYGARSYNNSTKLSNSKWHVANYGYKCSESHEEIKKIISTYGLALETEKLVDATKFIADSIASNKILAICREAQEVGDRALGFRSIVCLPNIEMRDAVNSKVKFREWWRPFAPMILDEYMDQLFSLDRPEPFMTVVYPVTKDYDSSIAGIVHIDKTARLQTIEKESNPFIYQVLKNLKEFHNLPPIIINTSFNINGQSMVRTTYDALMTFLSSSIDQLIINDTLIKKNDSSYILPPKSVSSFDRIMEPYIYNCNNLNLFFHTNPLMDTTSLKEFLASSCITNKFSKSVNNITIFSNYSTDKQRFYYESLISKHLKRRIVVKQWPTDEDLMQLKNSKNLSLSILLAESQLLPKKVGHVMSSFELPQKNIETKQIHQLIDYLSDQDLIVDNQLRPIKVMHWNNLNLIEYTTGDMSTE